MSHFAKCIFWVGVLLGTCFLSSCRDSSVGEQEKRLPEVMQGNNILIGIVAESESSDFFL